MLIQGKRTGVSNCLHAQYQVGHIVETVEHAEHVHARFDGLFTKSTEIRKCFVWLLSNEPCSLILRNELQYSCTGEFPFIEYIQKEIGHIKVKLLAYLYTTLSG